MNRLLWALQWVFGIYWVTIGTLHFVLPDGLPAQMSWMYDLSPTLHVDHGSFATTGPLNAVIMAVMLFIAWGRSRRAPLVARAV